MKLYKIQVRSLTSLPYCGDTSTVPCFFFSKKEDWDCCCYLYYLTSGGTKGQFIRVHSCPGNEVVKRNNQPVVAKLSSNGLKPASRRNMEDWSFIASKFSSFNP